MDKHSLCKLFTFSYTIYVPVDYKQSITVNGKFGYVVDNERRF